jgi:hypothetical protein
MDRVAMKLSAEELHDVLLIFREHLLHCWRRFHAETPHSLPLAFSGASPAVLSSLTCQQTSAFLYKQLSQLGVEDVEPCGGSMRHAEPLEGGLKDTSRRDVDADGYVWAGHYWLEHNGMVIDITKDQFGWEFSDIHVIEDSAWIYWKRPGFFPVSDLNMFAAAVSRFEGASRLASAGDDQRAQVKLSFERAMARAAAVAGIPSARMQA